MIFCNEKHIQIMPIPLRLNTSTHQIWTLQWFSLPHNMLKPAFIYSIEYSQWTWNGSCRDQWTAPPQRSSWDQRQSTPARSDTASPYCCALSPACHIAPVQPCWSCEGLLSRSTSHLSHILCPLKCCENTIPLFDSKILISRGKKMTDFPYVALNLKF